MKIARKFKYILMLTCLTASACLVFLINLHMKEIALHQAEEKANLLLERNLAGHAFLNQMLKPAVFEALEKHGAVADFDPRWMSSTYAIREIDARFSEHAVASYYYKECAVNARSPENEADPFEREFLERLNNDPALTTESRILTLEGEPYLSILHRGETMEQDCLLCHSTPEAAPPGLVVFYGDSRSFRRQAGEVVSAVSVRIPLLRSYQDANQFSLQLSFLVGAVFLSLYLWQQRLARKSVLDPLEELHQKVRAIASDPLRLGETVSIPPGRELRELAQDFNLLSNRLRLQQQELESQVAARTAELMGANEELQRRYEEIQHKERELVASEHRLKILFEYAPDAYYLCDENGTFLDGNLVAEQLSGYPRHELIGSSYFHLNLLPEDQLSAARERLRKTLGGTPGAPHQIFLRRKDGSHIWLETRTYPVQIDGRTQILGIARDITENKKTELDLRQSETRYRELSQEFQALLDGIPDSLTLLSPQMRIVWSNEGTGRLLGREPELLNGRLCRELWCGESCDEQGCPCRRTLRTGHSESARIHTADGRIWGVKTFPLEDGQGSIRGIIRWCSDITEKARMEEESLRTSHLASLGELAAGVAHEINNPNALVLLNISLLTESYQDALPILDDYHREQGDFILGGIPFSRMREQIPHLFSEMADAAQRIRRIVEDLKNFVRQEPGDFDEEIDLNRSAHTAVRLTASTVRKATSRFSIDLETDLPSLRGNSQRLEQVIVNLLLNACQALGSPDQEIALRTRRDAERRRLVLEVVDEGHGIDPQDLPHLTDPFFTTRRESGGTGLGLSVSARIVKEHGGSLFFDSRPGQGTTVTIHLPYIERPT